MRAPFDKNGNLMHFAHAEWREELYGYDKAHEWRDVETFEVGTLTLEGLCRGRSAAYFMWRDDRGRTYPMFMKDIVELLKASDVVGGVLVYPQLRIRKRGQNYGIGLATP